jgi:flagellar basal-body rod modification protein FlgD
MAAIASALASHAAASSPHTASAANSSSSSNGTSSTNNSVANDALANEQTFLQLLVSQLKNQDPTSPMDGTQFVTQLAQFSQLEQDLAMRQDLDKIAGAVAPATS